MENSHNILITEEEYALESYGDHHNLVDHYYEMFISQMTMDILLFMWMFSFLYHCQYFLPDMLQIKTNLTMHEILTPFVY